MLVFISTRSVHLRRLFSLYFLFFTLCISLALEKVFGYQLWHCICINNEERVSFSKISYRSKKYVHCCCFSNGGCSQTFPHELLNHW
ncbi:hypothetical protein DFP73DRAFT_118044 [Morchella snyderi]|nr:hypothetical protein DFP73DRAFT_118044 [Morchella snyderi]